MRETYDYLEIDLAPQGPGEFRASARSRAEAGLGPGAVLVGGWMGAGSIGWHDHEAVVLVGWGGAPGDPCAWLSGWDAVGGVRSTRLRATARPESPAPVRPGGVHAHRWLELDPADHHEAVDLSAQAWPAFEAGYDAHVEGLFATEDDPGRLVLVTWYQSVAEWERSRGVGAEAGGELEEARRRFQRRRQLTRRQLVRLATVPI